MPEPVSLRQGRLSAAVDPMGAQLLSLQLDGCEYLWQGDPRFWARRAPVLFPIVGAITSGEQAKKLDALIDEAIANSGR